jgi:hypothetical protein
MDFWTLAGQSASAPQASKPAMPEAWNRMKRENRHGVMNAGAYHLHVLLAPGRTHVEKPVLWVWGFDPASVNRTPEDFFLLLNGTWTDSEDAPDSKAALVEKLWDRGYDVLIFVPSDTTRHVSQNAEALVSCLLYLRTGGGEGVEGAFPVPANAIIGISMGGVIARYALRSMELNGQEHGTQLYFSYDTPHRGANIPLSVQYFLDYFAYGSTGIRFGAIADKLDLVNSPAARELAFYHYDAPKAGSSVNNRWESQTAPQPHPWRRNLLDALDKMGNYPLTRERRFAISNGGAAQSQGAGAGQQLLEVKIGPFGNPGAIFKALPQYDENTTQGVDVATCWSGLNKWTATVKVARPLEVCAGSTGPFLRDVRVNLSQKFSGFASIGAGYHDQVCFVPVASALDIGDDIWNLGPAPGRPVTLENFADYFVNADRNEPHVRVTSEIQTFILKKLEAWPA